MAGGLASAWPAVRYKTAVISRLLACTRGLAIPWLPYLEFVILSFRLVKTWSESQPIQVVGPDTVPSLLREAQPPAGTVFRRSSCQRGRVHPPSRYLPSRSVEYEECAFRFSSREHHGLPTSPERRLAPYSTPPAPGENKPFECENLRLWQRPGSPPLMGGRTPLQSKSWRLPPKNEIAPFLRSRLPYSYASLALRAISFWQCYLH